MLHTNGAQNYLPRTFSNGGISAIPTIRMTARGKIQHAFFKRRVQRESLTHAETKVEVRFEREHKEHELRNGSGRGHPAR